MIFGKHINRYYVKYAPQLLLGILALLVVDFLQLKIPEYYGMIVDGIRLGEIDGKAFNIDFLLDEICLPMIWVVLAMVACRFIWRICIFGSGVRLETELRQKMFASAKSLSVQYYQRNKVGGMMSLFTNDLETVQDCFSNGVLMFFDALLLGGLAIAKMLNMSWKLTLLTLIPMTFLLAIGTVLGRFMENKWDKRQAAYSELSDFAQENFSGLSVVKAFVKEFRELMAFKKINKKNEEINVAYTRSSVLLRILVTLFVESVICIILGYGGYLVYSDVFTTGQLVEFISYFSSIVWPVMAVSELIEMRSRGMASLKRVGELMDERPDVFDREDVLDIESIRGDIEFRGLTFRYPDADYDALKNVSLKIKAGENVGIIGKTGSGKTTLVDLILRTYNVPDGTVFIDGNDVNGIPIRRVREFCAYVPQDNFLFSDTIANNIAFSLDKFDMESVKEAAALAAVDGNIAEFTEGYDTVLGERGVTVSGGQKQRISIARALMKNAPVLILDDSVSAVDTDTERTILNNLRKTREGKTTILIAHRVSTVQGMDKIAFIDDGKILDFGTHEELLERCEQYRKTVALQRLEDEN